MAAWTPAQLCMHVAAQPLPPITIWSNESRLLQHDVANEDSCLLSGSLHEGSVPGGQYGCHIQCAPLFMASKNVLLRHLTDTTQA